MRNLIIASNSCWNIYHYRLPLLLALKNENYKISIMANDDIYRKNLEEYGFKFYETSFQKKSINPLVNILLMIKYFNVIKMIKPDLILFLPSSQIFL